MPFWKQLIIEIKYGHLQRFWILFRHTWEISSSAAFATEPLNSPFSSTSVVISTDYLHPSITRVILSILQTSSEPFRIFKQGRLNDLVFGTAIQLKQ